MLIKARDRGETRPYPWIFLRWIAQKKIIFLFLILFVYTGGIFFTLRHLYESGLRSEIKYVLFEMDYNDIFENYFFLPNYFKSFFVSPEKLRIDIKHRDYLELAEYRRIALERGQITDDLKVYVPAKIGYGGQSHAAKVRLKGEWLDNVRGDKWSLRVQIKGNDSLFGMKRFSIQHPRTRNYIYEWLYLNALKQEGVVALRYDFVDVTLNGEDLGIFALEEHFDKILIENNRQREGLVLRLNADYRYRPVSIDPGLYWDRRAGLREEHASYIEVYGQEKVLDDQDLRRQFQTAHELLHGLRTKKFATHEVFDVEKLARYFAISDLLGARQAPKDWSDIRFYYNPITARLEPIGVEGHVKGPIDSLLGSHRSVGETSFALHDIIFGDEVLYRHYVQNLERVSQESFLDELINRNEDALKENLTILSREWPHRIFSDAWLRENQKTIRGFLNPAVGLHAYMGQNSHEELSLDLGNIQYMPIEVMGVSLGGQVATSLDGSIILSPRKSGYPPEYSRHSFRMPGGARLDAGSLSELKVQYRILGASQDRLQTVFSWPVVPERPLLSHALDAVKGNVDQFVFVNKDELSKTILIPAGSWSLTSRLVIPEGYSFVVEPGTRITFRQSGSIVSYSPLRWQGRPDAPIILEGSEVGGTGGVAVLRAQEDSILSHVTFRNLSSSRDGEQVFLGAASFFESPVLIEACRFTENRGEDSLNIVRGTFALRDVLFDNNEGDAFDADFTTGSIVRTSFLRSGNDAIDVSGSKITMEDVLVRGAQDKAVSVGENSVVVATRLEIRDVELGIASKDLSKVQLRDGVIRDSRVGLIAFMKKPEFGPASITVDGLTLENLEKDYLIENGSIVRVDGISITPNHQNVKSMLYGVEYGVD